MSLRPSAIALFVLLGNAAAGAQAPAAKPLEPVSAILDAFRSSRIVAIPDAHRNEQTQAFNLSLIRDPRFAQTVDDIVVEFGNALHQSVVDRFVGGEDVSDELLKPIWMDTTLPSPGWDTPQPEEFLRTVRAVNTTLPKDQMLRVLLGDPPIEWQKVKTKDDHFKFLAMRETFPAELIRREVLEKGRRALIVYGIMHFQRKNAAANFESAGPAASLVSVLEDSGAARVFSVWLEWEDTQLQPDIDSWPVPSLAIIRGTVLGAAEFEYDGPRFAIRDGKADFSAPLPRESWRSLKREDQYDAILYLGPRSTMTNALVPPRLCADPNYVEMRRRRMALVEWRPDELKDYCAR
jgi:hypothetical protein